MKRVNRFLRSSILLALLGVVAYGAPFGKVVGIGGHASDIALDEQRNLLYIANFTANRIEVLDRGSLRLQEPIRVTAQPNALAISPDARYLVITHVANWPVSPIFGVTILDLATRGRRQITFGLAPLTVSFGADGLALIATTENFQLLNPVTGTTQILISIAELATTATLPVPKATFPPEIIRASSAASGNSQVIYGFAESGSENRVMTYRYDVAGKSLRVIGITSEPPLGPRVMSVNEDGTLFIEGWAMQNTAGVLLAQFPNASGKFNIGSHAIDSRRSLVYAQVEVATETAEPGNGPGSPATPSTPAASPTGPVLEILDSDNLTVRERLQLPENLAGRSLMSRDGETMYSVSDSGVIMLPIGALAQHHRVMSLQEDVLFRGSFCERNVVTKEIEIVNPGGGSTPFAISSPVTGVTVSPSSGTTPLRVSVSVDPNVFRNQKGTTAVPLEITSGAAVNLPQPVRVLINTREPDQRGEIFNVPGRLVDMLADPPRNRFYILRQDRNLVLVFDRVSFEQVAALRTGNTPTHMGMTLDRRYLIVGNDNSQIANVYDLETLQQDVPIVMPPGHYPRSIAASREAILVASRVAGPEHTIDRVDWRTRTAVRLPTLGVYENDIDVNTVLAPTPSGQKILIAMADGNVMIYDATSDAFAVSRQDFDALGGAYGAPADDLFVVDSHVLNRSLVPVSRLGTQTGSSSGFDRAGGFGIRTTTPSLSSPGVIERVDLETASGLRATRMAESPALPQAGFAFIRSLAPFTDGLPIVSLSQSGFTVLPWNYDEALAEPAIDRVVNGADFTAGVAPGGLISIFGQGLATGSFAAHEFPLPTFLGESCLTVNDRLLPVLYSSSGQINAQLPFDTVGTAEMILRTPGGVSKPFSFTILQAAPAIFRSGTAGPRTALATIVRAKNNELVTLSNPVHPEDILIIYVTGLGRTTANLRPGDPAPADPLAVALLEPEVTLGGVSLPVLFAGLVPGLSGVYQINATVPYWVSQGMEIPLTIASGGYTTSISVRVVK